MKSKLFLLTLLMAGVLSASAALIGGYNPINDTKDPYVVEIAKFAVSEHNKEASSKLVFVKVLSGEKQVVSGTNYKLDIQAKLPKARRGYGKAQIYEAIVYDKPWEKYRNLTSFTKLDNKN